MKIDSYNSPVKMENLVSFSKQYQRIKYYEQNIKCHTVKKNVKRNDVSDLHYIDNFNQVNDEL